MMRCKDYNPVEMGVYLLTPKQNQLYQGSGIIKNPACAILYRSDCLFTGGGNSTSKKIG
jgi:hypothetical protein